MFIGLKPQIVDFEAGGGQFVLKNFMITMYIQFVYVVKNVKLKIKQERNKFNLLSNYNDQQICNKC